MRTILRSVLFFSFLLASFQGAQTGQVAQFGDTTQFAAQIKSLAAQPQASEKQFITQFGDFVVTTEVPEKELLAQTSQFITFTSKHFSARQLKKGNVRAAQEKKKIEIVTERKIIAGCKLHLENKKSELQKELQAAADKNDFSAEAQADWTIHRIDIVLVHLAQLMKKVTAHIAATLPWWRRYARHMAAAAILTLGVAAFAKRDWIKEKVFGKDEPTQPGPPAPPAPPRREPDESLRAALDVFRQFEDVDLRRETYLRLTPDNRRRLLEELGLRESDIVPPGPGPRGEPSGNGSLATALQIFRENENDAQLRQAVYLSLSTENRALLRERLGLQETDIVQTEPDPFGADEPAPAQPGQDPAVTETTNLWQFLTLEQRITQVAQLNDAQRAALRPILQGRGAQGIDAAFEAAAAGEPIVDPTEDIPLTPAQQTDLAANLEAERVRIMADDPSLQEAAVDLMVNQLRPGLEQDARNETLRRELGNIDQPTLNSRRDVIKAMSHFDDVEQKIDALNRYYYDYFQTFLPRQVARRFVLQYGNHRENVQILNLPTNYATMLHMVSIPGLDPDPEDNFLRYDDLRDAIRQIRQAAARDDSTMEELLAFVQGLGRHAVDFDMLNAVAATEWVLRHNTPPVGIAHVNLTRRNSLYELFLGESLQDLFGPNLQARDELIRRYEAERTALVLRLQQREQRLRALPADLVDPQLFEAITQAVVDRNQAGAVERMQGLVEQIDQHIEQVEAEVEDQRLEQEVRARRAREAEHARQQEQLALRRQAQMLNVQIATLIEQLGQRTEENAAVRDGLTTAQAGLEVEITDATLAQAQAALAAATQFIQPREDEDEDEDEESDVEETEEQRLAREQAEERARLEQQRAAAVRRRREQTVQEQTDMRRQLQGYIDQFTGVQGLNDLLTQLHQAHDQINNEGWRARAQAALRAAQDEAARQAQEERARAEARDAEYLRLETRMQELSQQLGERGEQYNALEAAFGVMRGRTTRQGVVEITPEQGIEQAQEAIRAVEQHLEEQRQAAPEIAPVVQQQWELRLDRLRRQLDNFANVNQEEVERLTAVLNSASNNLTTNQGIEEARRVIGQVQNFIDEQTRLLREAQLRQVEEERERQEQEARAAQEAAEREEEQARQAAEVERHRRGAQHAVRLAALGSRAGSDGDTGSDSDVEEQEATQVQVASEEQSRWAQRLERLRHRLGNFADDNREEVERLTADLNNASNNLTTNEGIEVVQRVTNEVQNYIDEQTRLRREARAQEEAEAQRVREEQARAAQEAEEREAEATRQAAENERRRRAEQRAARFTAQGGEVGSGEEGAGE